MVQLGGWDADVAILGGGLAGLSLALQLRQQRPDVRVVVIEKARFPVREATHKVGESTVEIAATYFGGTLGLRELCEQHHLPKLGLRFFFSDGDNRDLGRRPELGARKYMPVRSWQVDRGRFENQLAALGQEAGVELIEGAKVREVRLGSLAHEVRYDDGQERTLRARWVVDATGRRALLKRQLGLARLVNHDVNASWFRVSDAIDIESWSSTADFAGWTDDPRRLSTNHLMGDGYWAWIIPLPSGGTSLGIVGEAERHPFGALRSEEASRAWLDHHEPQLANAVRGRPFDDFAALKHFSHGARKLFSVDRWALVGDAGVFLDPFYSPGSDFVGMGNVLLADGLLADLDGEPDAAERITRHDRTMLITFRAFLANYRRRYPLMGRPGPMRTKIVWDFTTYWSLWAPWFASGRFGDLAFADRCGHLLRGLFEVNLEVQEFLSRWGEVAPAIEDPARFDYSDQAWLRELNADMVRPCADDDELLARLERNVTALGELATELVDRARSGHSELSPLPVATPEPTMSRLEWLSLGR